ncbi:hypothetical protein Adt_39656 [Abeliophyllum distichum]|uniref:Uncharacterized protein n=1 Tax=Abeliophyllum distichum TaxID=126358 RepID=A0ABD1Q5X2_9LAMI
MIANRAMQVVVVVSESTSLTVLVLGVVVWKDNEMVLKTLKFLKDSVDGQIHIVSPMISLFLVEDTAKLSREGRTVDEGNLQFEGGAGERKEEFLTEIGIGDSQVAVI